MAADRCQALPSFYSDYSKNCYLFLFPTSLTNIVIQDFCVSHNYLCSLEKYKFHLVLIGTSFRQILQRLDKYVYTYQENDCLYTLFKHRFHSSIQIPSSGEVFNHLSRAVQQLTIERNRKDI